MTEHSYFEEERIMNEASRPPRRPRFLNTKGLLIAAGAVVVAGVAYYFLSQGRDLSGRIVIPYVAHQRPVLDPHIPSSHALSDKLDELLYDGLFNVSATPSGISYEDGLGELIGIDERNVVTVRLKRAIFWHDAYKPINDEENPDYIRTDDHQFSAADVAYSLERIQRLGSLSPDYILVSQALETIGFQGPNERDEIRFLFKGDRIWTEADIKEVLSFKVIPRGNEPSRAQHTDGTGPYLVEAQEEGVYRFTAPSAERVRMVDVELQPFIDNSTYTTEFRGGAVNVLLETPFGSISPVLSNPQVGFVKSNISTTFFAVLFNVQRLNRTQRVQLRQLLNSRTILERFFKVNTEQQREIVDYKGNRNNYADYRNGSVFPATTYYVEEQIIEPEMPDVIINFGILPDTVRIKACLDAGYREEYTELIGILNDPAVTLGRIRATAVPNEDLRTGNYDALLVAFSGYRSNFLFDLYSIFLREPDLLTYQVNLEVEDDWRGRTYAHPRSLQSDRNFFRMDAQQSPEEADIRTLLDYIYSFMSTRNVGDKQEYARRVDALEREMALGAWLFSLPSLAYFSDQFDPQSVHLYGVASQLSTIEYWEQRPAGSKVASFDR